MGVLLCLLLVSMFVIVVVLVFSSYWYTNLYFIDVVWCCTIYHWVAVRASWASLTDLHLDEQKKCDLPGMTPAIPLHPSMVMWANWMKRSILCRRLRFGASTPIEESAPKPWNRRKTADLVWSLGSLNWGYPKMDGLEWKIQFKWMMSGYLVICLRMFILILNLCL